jgi:hypothetical protein
MPGEAAGGLTMENEPGGNEVARRSAVIYLPLSLGLAMLFLAGATVVGGYPLVARIGGAVWVGLLSLIVSMPLVTSRVKKWWRNRTANG